MTVISWECVSASRDLLWLSYATRRRLSAHCASVCSDAPSYEVAEVAETAEVAKQKGVRTAIRFPLCAFDFDFIFAVTPI